MSSFIFDENVYIYTVVVIQRRIGSSQKKKERKLVFLTNRAEAVLSGANGHVRYNEIIGFHIRSYNNTIKSK